MEQLKGILKILILKELERNSLSGQELMNRIGQKTAKRPSPGSVYPILHELLSSGFLDMRVDGKRKIYSLSDHGKRVLEEFSKREKQAILSKIEVLRDWGVISTEESNDMIDFVEMKRENFLRLFRLRNWVRFVTMLSKIARKSEERAEEILESAIRQMEDEVEEV